MPAAYQSHSRNAAATGLDAVVNTPSGTVDGDLLVAQAVCTAGTTVAISGKTPHASSLGSQFPLWVWVASSEPASRTFVTTGTGNIEAVIVRINGQAPTNAVDAASGASGSGAVALAIPSVTSAGVGRLLFQLVSKINSGITWSGPATQTERFDATTVPGCSAGGDEIVGTGATGTRTWTPSAGAAPHVGYMLAIAPAVVPSTGEAFLSIL